MLIYEKRVWFEKEKEWRTKKQRQTITITRNVNSPSTVDLSIIKSHKMTLSSIYELKNVPWFGWWIEARRSIGVEGAEYLKRGMKSFEREWNSEERLGFSKVLTYEGSVKGNTSQPLMMATCALVMECVETSPQNIVRIASLTRHVGRRGWAVSLFTKTSFSSSPGCLCTGPERWTQRSMVGHSHLCQTSQLGRVDGPHEWAPGMCVLTFIHILNVILRV